VPRNPGLEDAIPFGIAVERCAIFPVSAPEDLGKDKALTPPQAPNWIDAGSPAVGSRDSGV